MEIKKGHVYIAGLNPRIGTEPGKVRPVVVVQTEFLGHHTQFWAATLPRRV